MVIILSLKYLANHLAHYTLFCGLLHLEYILEYLDYNANYEYMASILEYMELQEVQILGYSNTDFEYLHVLK